MIDTYSHPNEETPLRNVPQQLKDQHTIFTLNHPEDSFLFDEHTLEEVAIIHSAH